MSQNHIHNTKQAIEVFTRISLLILLMYWCFEILSPFIMPVLWGIILAVALAPLQQFIQKYIGQRKKLAAIIITILFLAILIVPASYFIHSLASSILEFKTEIENGTFSLLEPKEAIKKWPVIGEKLHTFLTLLTEHSEEFIAKYQSEITTSAKVILTGVVGTSLSVLQILVSIILAGILLATKGTEEAAIRVFNKLIDDKGEEFALLMGSTIRNVVKGVLGVALIQAVLAGFGLYLAHIPNAGLWGLLCLLLCIIQIGPGIILIGASIYLFSNAEFFTATLWTIYFLVIMFSDNVLKPILLGKGASVPMLVIFLGVIGGFMLSGFIGLFTGAIVLSIGYKLFIVWLDSPNKPDLN